MAATAVMAAAVAVEDLVAPAESQSEWASADQTALAVMVATAATLGPQATEATVPLAMN